VDNAAHSGIWNDAAHASTIADRSKRVNRLTHARYGDLRYYVTSGTLALLVLANIGPKRIG
jgi:hypothetical protein